LSVLENLRRRSWGWFGFVDRLFGPKTPVFGVKVNCVWVEFQDSKFDVSGRLDSLGYRGWLFVGRLFLGRSNMLMEDGLGAAFASFCVFVCL
jgi:hypothetical protein